MEQTSTKKTKITIHAQHQMVTHYFNLFKDLTQVQVRPGSKAYLPNYKNFLREQKIYLQSSNTFLLIQNHTSLPNRKIFLPSKNTYPPENRTNPLNYNIYHLPMELTIIDINNPSKSLNIYSMISTNMGPFEVSNHIHQSTVLSSLQSLINTVRLSANNRLHCLVDRAKR